MSTLQMAMVQKTNRPRFVMRMAEKRPSTEEYFMGIARLVKERSTCNRTHVGAIIVKDKRIITTGYNGAPKGMPHCTDAGCNITKMKHPQSDNMEDHCTRTLHAEQNAIIQAAIFGTSINNGVMYCTHSPCFNCAKMIINAGIKEVVFENGYPDKFAEEIFSKCEVKLTKFGK